MASSFAAITLLADRPDLAVTWAELHWREWGNEPGREEMSWWVADASLVIRRMSVPVAFIALGHDDTVLGGVGLHEFDLSERRDRSPLVVGAIVRAERRGEGIGQALMARLEAWALAASIAEIWVATGTAGRAVAFYQRCGYRRVEELAAQRGEMVTIVTKHLAPTQP